VIGLAGSRFVVVEGCVDNIVIRSSGTGTLDNRRSRARDGSSQLSRGFDTLGWWGWRVASGNSEVV
jgi:hypothetical protein